MIRYLDPLFTTEQTTKKVGKFKFNVKYGIGMVGLYIITLSSNEKDVFDIYPVPLFKQRSFRKRDFDIVGFAESREAAFTLVQEIYEDYYRANRTYLGIRDFFAEKFKHL